MEDLYRKVTKILEDRGIPYSICFGSLLGYHREGGIIPGDNDIDLIVPIKHYLEVLGLFLEMSHFRDYPNYFMVKDKKGNQLDFYFYTEDFNTDTLMFGNVCGYKARFTRSHFLPFKQGVFLGKKISIPRDPDAICKYIYGNYMISMPKDSYKLEFDETGVPMIILND